MSALIAPSSAGPATAGPLFVDSHCHLDFPDLRERLDTLLEHMADRQVIHALCVSVTLDDWPGIMAMVADRPQLSASVGVHPDYPDTTEPTVADLVGRAAHPQIVAIGETGLDYYRSTGPMQWQQDRFRVHIQAARATGLPLIIHTRSASDDTLRLMREEGADTTGGVMHCFTESWEVARAALDMGFHISFSGIVTFRNAEQLREVARRVPLDRMLIETDSPYLAPVPRRGKTNEPAWVVHVAECIAQLRGIEVAEIARHTTANFFRLFPVRERAAAAGNQP